MKIVCPNKCRYVASADCCKVKPHKTPCACCTTKIFTIDINEYRAIKNKYEALIKETEDEIKALHPKASDYMHYLNFGFNLLQNVDTVYVSSNTHLKNQILCSMYAENFIFEEKDYRTPIYHSELSLILNAVKEFESNKKGQSQNMLTMSSMVPTKGIEPSRPCERQILSLLRLPIPPHGLLSIIHFLICVFAGTAILS